MRGAEPATFRGRIVAVDGDPPRSLWYAPPDETVECAFGELPCELPCEVDLEGAFGPYNATVRVACGGQVLYGGETMGAVQCETRDGRALRCRDDSGTGADGDPMVVLDRERGRLVVHESRHWSVLIALVEDPTGDP
jgi:hypothetical protein